MKLAEHVEQIRQLIDKAFRNRLGRMGITASAMQPVDAIPAEYREDRKRIESIREVFIAETGTATDGYEKLVEELSFTLFNRLAALKVMEAHTLHPEIVTRRSQHGERSFAHRHWLEKNPDGKKEEHEGLVRFLEDQLAALAADIPLFSLHHPYHLLPTAIELNGIINAFNQVEADAQVETDIWKSDDVLGWLYESYNNAKKTAHKDSGAKIEFNNVSLRSQTYTPRWVVKFLVDNSLGKLYLEMFPDSGIKEKYKIANVPKTQTRERKPLTDIRLIDPTTGSGNYLLYAFDLFYDLYTDQINNYGADYDENKIPELIIRHNLHGVDLDDRAVQLAQLGLYIKVKRKKRSAKIEHFNIVSSDFFLPDYKEVKHLFQENGKLLDAELENIVIDLWADLQQAYKFSSLIRLDEKFNSSLHQLVEKKKEERLFIKQTLANYERFRENFFANLQKAVAHNTEKQGLTFLNTKTRDAITFLQLLTQKYDVAVANPPYTDSGDFGPELKRFIDANYKKPYKFNTNLYATFIKQCCELTDETGYVALIHPHTFMFIKSFEDVRKYMIEHTHIDLLVDYGLDRVNLFGTGILLDATWYVLSKKKKDDEGIYFNITANQQEKHKQSSLEQAYDDAINNRKNERTYTLDQSKLKIIEGWPFIYWISDGFRKLFFGQTLEKIAKVSYGVKTGNNIAMLRYWWEIDSDEIFDFSNKQKWVRYSKGGPYNRWYGNIWLCLNWYKDGALIRKQSSYSLPAEQYCFKQGICFPDASSKGICFRLITNEMLYDKGSTAIFSKYNDYFVLAVLNSKLISYVVDCFNPTVSKMPNDIKRIPFPSPAKEIEETLTALSKICVKNKMELCKSHLVEYQFSRTPITIPTHNLLNEKLLTFLNIDNLLNTEIFIHEAIINKIVYEFYEISEDDKKMVESKQGKSIGELPVCYAARNAYLSEAKPKLDIVKKYITELPAKEYEDQQIQKIKSEFGSLYKSNNDLEEFCIRHQLNPINVWYWFRESRILPQGRAAEIALEFLADACRTILMEDEDGIIPLIGLPGEPRLLDRLEQHCLNQGFTSAQFMQLDGLLGRPINEYIEHHFFKNFSDHLNLFMYLPKTPFIWHLSSGVHQGFEAYIIIYKWNRDSLFKLKTQYLSKRAENLEYRQIQLADSNTAQAQSEKETIRLQLQEITEFTTKIDELIAEGYDPKLDDGVGKNIAPLQNKGLLRSEVLNKKQLEKYLKADW